MTVAELIEALKAMPQDAVVVSLSGGAEEMEEIADADYREQEQYWAVNQERVAGPAVYLS